MFWIMLFNEFPFDHNNRDVLVSLILKGMIDWNRCDKFSKEFVDLLKGLLDSNKNSRLSAQQALNHPAYKNISQQTIDLSKQEVVSKKFINQENKLMKGLKMFCLKLNPNIHELNQLKKVFINSDSNFDG